MQEKINSHGYNVTSQHGEDGIIEYILSVIGDRVVKLSCEFGAHNGILASNTWRLWNQPDQAANEKWQAILIEGDQAHFPALARIGAGNANVRVIKQFVGTSGKHTLDEIFAREGLPTEIGVLSIDIDSYDYYIWNSVRVVNAQVVLVEFNQSIPPHVDYVDPDGEMYLRCSLKALERLGQQKGYKLVCATLTNAIFIRNDLFDPMRLPDLPAEALFDWSAVAPILVKINHEGNKYPIWSTNVRSGFKWWVKLYYRLSSLYKRRQQWSPPPQRVKDAMRKAGLDF